MKKKLLSYLTILTIILPFIFCTHHQARADVELMDGRLILTGFIREMAWYRTAMTEREDMYSSNRLQNLTTNVLFEALYTVKEGVGYNDTTIRLFAGFKWWWEKSHYFNDDMNRAILHQTRKDWVHPREFEDDTLTEAYIEVVKGPLEIRVGKQIVIWGQMNLEKVADVVNPIDVTHGFPGVLTWEELKRGLWMIRTIYESDLPGGLIFETIMNPGDFECTLMPGLGTFPGGDIWTGRAFSQKEAMGFWDWNREKMLRDAPTWNWSNWELGIRVRGQFGNLDWAVFYWNARSDYAVAHPKKGPAFNIMHVKNGMKTMFTGRTQPHPDWPDYKVYYYKRYQTIGGTAQYEAYRLWQTVWRLEWFFEFGAPLQVHETGQIGNESSPPTDWTRRNNLGIALQVNRPLNIPWFTHSFIACDALLDFSFTYGYYKVLNHDHKLGLTSRHFNWEDSHADVIDLFMMQPLFHQTWTFIMTGNYWLSNNKWMLVPTLSYALPGQHWRIDGSYVMLGGPTRSREWEKLGMATNYSSMDFIMLRLRFEW